MSRVLAAGALALIVLGALAASGRAALLRYALVVGVNQGRDAGGEVYEPALEHAERDALRLRDALIERSGFGTGPRTVALIGATRVSLHAAIEELAARVAEDKRQFPAAKVLFAFFYSGHGVADNVLLADGPMSAAELTRALDRVRADLRLGVVDACESASLAGGRLTQKGMRPVPGADLARALPEEALNAEGNIWFFSSSAGEPSFEDPELGGVFTHFFVEALSRAPRDRNQAASLDAIWEYARRKTVSLTHALGRPQSPLRVTNTMSTAPLWFAWDWGRATTLVVGPAVHGRVALYYGGDLLVTFDKAPGVTVERAVYPGRAEVVVQQPDGARERQSIELRRGARVLLEPEPTVRAHAPFGFGVHRLAPKGNAHERWGIAVEREATTVALGPALRAVFAGERRLAPRLGAAVELRVDHGPWVVALTGGLGIDSGDFEAWGYEVRGLQVALSGGGSFDLSWARVTPLLRLGAGHAWQTFDDQAERRGWVFEAGAGVAMAIPLGEVFALTLGLDAGLGRAKGIAAGAGYGWRGSGAGDVGLLFRFR